MTDQFLPPGWFTQSATWPYWPKSLVASFTPPTYEPWNQIDRQSWQQPFGASVGSFGPPADRAWSPAAPASAPSISPTGGILGNFPQQNDAEEGSPAASSFDGSLGSSSGLLALLDQRNAVGGILAPLERLNSGQDRSLPTWWQSAAPVAENLDPFATSPSGLPPLDPLRHQPAMRNAVAQEPSDAGFVVPPPYLESAKYWGAAPSHLPGTSEPPTSYGRYLSPVPTAPSWDSIPPYPAERTVPDSAEPPAAEPSSASTPASGVESAPADEAAQAQQARDAAALRLGRRERPAVERAAPPTPSTEANEGEPSLAERLRLHFLDSYYRGGLLGALRLASLARLAATSDEPGTSPEIRRVNDNLRQEYRQTIADLARYDRMRSFHGASEFGAAALGQFGGGMLSPESWIGLGAKGANWLWRAGKAGLQQGAINAATDPVVQGLNTKAGAQDQFDPWRTAIASGTGFAAGAAAKSIAEALSPPRFFDPRLTKAEQLNINQNVGRAWEARKGDDLQRWGLEKISPQVTIMPPGGRSVRSDYVAWDPKLNRWRCFECKASASAPDTPRQKENFPKIEQYGGTVRGEGKSDLPGGTFLPPMKIEYLRP